MTPTRITGRIGKTHPRRGPGPRPAAEHPAEPLGSLRVALEGLAREVGHDPGPQRPAIATSGTLSSTERVSPTRRSIVTVRGARPVQADGEAHSRGR